MIIFPTKTTYLSKNFSSHQSTLQSSTIMKCDLLPTLDPSLGPGQHPARWRHLVLEWVAPAGVWCQGGDGEEWSGAGTARYSVLHRVHIQDTLHPPDQLLRPLGLVPGVSDECDHLVSITLISLTPMIHELQQVVKITLLHQQHPQHHDSLVLLILSVLLHLDTVSTRLDDAALFRRVSEQLITRIAAKRPVTAFTSDFIGDQNSTTCNDTRS